MGGDLPFPTSASERGWACRELPPSPLWGGLGRGLAEISRNLLRTLWALLALLLLPTLALAHAQLISSDPGDGATVASAPTAVTLTFNEPVSPITIKLARPDGSVSLVETFKADGAAIVITPPAGLASLSNLDQLPAKGAILIAAPLKFVKGTGSPVRALALIA